MSKGDRKQAYFAKLEKLFDEYTKILIVNADNVGSSQLQKIRKSLRGKAVLMMGKNTIVRKCVRGLVTKNEKLEALLPEIRYNVGLIFTNATPSEIKEMVDKNRVEAPARAGSVAPNDVVVPAGNTGLEPTKTSFFQALNIQTRISKGQIELINDVNLIKSGNKVTASEAALLQMLNIRPFFYGLKTHSVYDNGDVFDASVLSITSRHIEDAFRKGVQQIASLSLATGIPTKASVPHSLIRGFRNLLAVTFATNFSFPRAEAFKNIAKSAPPPAAAAPGKQDGGGKQKGGAPAKPEKVVEEKKESDGDMGLGLFD
jgi:large subunit ribosomal protein LP0